MPENQSLYIFESLLERTRQMLILDPVSQNPEINALLEDRRELLQQAHALELESLPEELRRSLRDKMDELNRLEPVLGERLRQSSGNLDHQLKKIHEVREMLSNYRLPQESDYTRSGEA